MHTFLCTLSFLKISVASSRCWFSKILRKSVLLSEALHVSAFHILLGVPTQQSQVQDKRQPVSVDQKEEGQESVYGSFGDDVGVETVAEVDRVDVVTGVKLACARDTVFAALRRGSPRSGARPHSQGRWFVPFQVAVHNREEDLEEEVDGVYQHRQQVQPCFARHRDSFCASEDLSYLGEIWKLDWWYSYEVFRFGRTIPACGRSGVCKLLGWARRGQLARVPRGLLQKLMTSCVAGQAQEPQ